MTLNAKISTLLASAALVSLAGAAPNPMPIPNPEEPTPKPWGIVAISVLNVREKPGNPAEMGTQLWMGSAFKILKEETNWFYVQSEDGYLGWTESGFVSCADDQIKQWKASPLWIVTALDDQILEQPDPEAQPVSDVVLCDLVKRIGETNDWLRVELPDGRSGYLAKKSAAEFAQWRGERRPTPENIERTAKSFLGRPYFWGCNTPRGMDCSGLTKLVFYLNGVDLNRNASQQAIEGEDVLLDKDLSQLRKGDLLFFGHRASKGHDEKVNHVAIYLGDKLFIQSAGMVRISSFDPASPICDHRRLHNLLRARRVLKE